jgi:hypothetical protein
MDLIERQKELKREAEVFWKDESNDFESRVRVFNTFADYDPFYPDISHPLSALFIWYQNRYDFNRYRLYDWDDIITTYLDEHTDRSPKLIDRVYKYMQALMIKSGYRGFRYEW